MYQIRDDYLNLQSHLYATNKGLGEDLGEGKFSLPIIHSIASSSGDNLLLNILKQRTEDENIKLYAINHMKATGSFQYCEDKLDMLWNEAMNMVNQLELSMGPCRRIRSILQYLKVGNHTPKSAD